MHSSLVLWSVLALVVFWMTGAYNRLMRLRALGLNAFHALAGWLEQYAALVRTHSPMDASDAALATVGTEPDTIASWLALAAAATQFSTALKAAQLQALDALRMRTLQTAWQTLQVSWMRLQETPPDLAGAALPATLLAQWSQLDAHVDAASAEFNLAVQAYNQAISQIPARLVAWLFGFNAAHKF